MSLGYCGTCRLLAEDDENIMYEYSGENWNDENSKSGDLTLYDGTFTIKKSSIESGDFDKAVENGGIIIEKECKNAFKRYDDSKIDYIAQRLLIHIFNYYEENKEFPKEESFIQ